MASATMEDAIVEVPPPPELPLQILQVVRSAHTQHGLRHGDYGRYRSYCTRRLRRLYKGLKFLHGRGKYLKKKLEPAHVLDSRHLHIPLVSAERAWAVAMELKAQLEAGPDPAKKRHLIRRLTKASAWAAELASLAAERGDARTGLEAEAYAASMAGTLLLERDQPAKALTSFNRAKKLVSQLSKVGSPEEQAACRERLEQLEPPIRYCTYQLERAGGAPEPSSPASATHQSQLEALGADTASGEVAAAEFSWRDVAYPVRSESVRVALATAAAAEAELADAMDTGNGESRLPLLDRLANAFAGARAEIQSALVNEATADPAELKALEVAVRGAALERSMERSRLMATAAEARLARTQQRTAAGMKAKDKERAGRAEDVVRLYDALVAFAADLGDLAADLGGAAGEYLIDEAAAQAAQYQAARCFYMALSFSASEQHVQAYSLLQRAVERVDVALTKHQECEVPDKAACQDLAALRLAAMGFRCSERALILVEEARLPDKVNAMDLEDTAAVESSESWLLTDNDKWHSYASSTEQRVAPIPCNLDSVAARPILLDSAQDHVAFPSLVHRAEQRQEAKSTFSRLFAWR